MIKTIAIIVISVSIFGLLLFVFVKNQIKKRIDDHLNNEKKVIQAIKILFEESENNEKKNKL